MPGFVRAAGGGGARGRADEGRGGGAAGAQPRHRAQPQGAGRRGQVSCDWWRAAGQYCAVIGQGGRGGGGQPLLHPVRGLHQRDGGGGMEEEIHQEGEDTNSLETSEECEEDNINCKLHYRCPFPTMK